MLLRRTLVLAVLVAFLCGPFASRAATTILLTGDSITNGGRNYVGYRYDLWFDLLNAGYDIDFVGNNHTLSPTESRGTPYPDLYPDYDTTFDRDHDGYWGIKSSEYLSQKSPAAAALAPDIAIINLGTNDIPGGGQGATNYQASMNNISAIIDQLRAVNSDVKIVLTQLTPPSTASPSFGAYGGKFPIFNQNIAALAASKSTAQSPIVVANQYQGFDPVAMTDDGIHPNKYGQQLMAARYTIALQTFLSPGEPPKSPAPRIGNTSFDDIVPGGSALSDGANTSAPGKSAWTFSRVGGRTDAGLFNPGPTTYTGAAGGGTPIGADGSQIAYLFNNAALSSKDELPSISQTIGSILLPDMKLALTVAVGNRLPGDAHTSTYGGYRIELWAGDTLIGFTEDEITPEDGTFADATLSLFTNDLDPALHGGSFTIRMTMTSLERRAATDFDNVRFEMTPIPEPGTIALLLLGGGLFALRGMPRRR